MIAPKRFAREVRENRERPRRKWKIEKPMTVGIVAACEGSRYYVGACDEALSYGTQAADVGAHKMMWFGDWCFVFAGALSSTELIVERIRYAVSTDDSALKREHIIDTVRRAYQARVTEWTEQRHFAPLGITIDKFFKTGKAKLGEKAAADLLRVIDDDYQQNFWDEVLVIGWGITPLALTIYKKTPRDDGLYGKDGMAVIGSGGDSALATLFLLEHGSHRTLEETIYSVAAAKFSSEAHGIGKSTRMWIGRKRLPSDKDKSPNRMLNPDEIEELRTVWEKYGRPRIPRQAMNAVADIVSDLGDEKINNRISIQSMIKRVNRRK
jgi:hypothetical protein